MKTELANVVTSDHIGWFVAGATVFIGFLKTFQIVKRVGRLEQKMSKVAEDVAYIRGKMS